MLVMGDSRYLQHRRNRSKRSGVRPLLLLLRRVIFTATHTTHRTSQEVADNQRHLSYVLTYQRQGSSERYSGGGERTPTSGGRAQGAQNMWLRHLHK